MLTVSYSINGLPVTKEQLKEIQIVKKDYIDYVENIKKRIREENEQYSGFLQSTIVSNIG